MRIFFKSVFAQSGLILPLSVATMLGCSSAQPGAGGEFVGGSKVAKPISAKVLDSNGSPRDESRSTSAGANESTANVRPDLSLAKVPSETEAAELIRADFAAYGQSAEIVYVDLRHLASSHSGTAELEGFRFGVAKTLNSISVAPTIVKLQAIDSGETLFRVKLSDYTLVSGWSEILKDKLARDNVSKIEGATVVKGDWLVYAATRPEVYNAVMRIPGNVQSLESEFGADYKKAVYVNAPASNVTFFGRILQRIPIDVGGKPGGYYWRSYDPVGKALESQGFSNPESLRFATLPALWAGEYFFSLPNGLQGYSLSGFIFQTRLDAQLFAATDNRRPQDGLTRCAGNAKNCGYVLNGESCMTCHAAGINSPVQILGFKGVATDRDAADLFSEDRERFVAALRELGYHNYQGSEPILETITEFKNRSKTSDKRVQAGELEGVTTMSGMFKRR